jgi:hypothetical protein
VALYCLVGHAVVQRLDHLLAAVQRCRLVRAGVHHCHHGYAVVRNCRLGHAMVPRCHYDCVEILNCRLDRVEIQRRHCGYRRGDVPAAYWVAAVAKNRTDGGSQGFRFAVWVPTGARASPEVMQSLAQRQLLAAMTTRFLVCGLVC